MSADPDINITELSSQGLELGDHVDMAFLHVLTRRRSDILIATCFEARDGWERGWVAEIRVHVAMRTLITKCMLLGTSDTLGEGHNVGLATGTGFHLLQWFFHLSKGFKGLDELSQPIEERLVNCVSFGHWLN